MHSFSLKATYFLYKISCNHLPLFASFALNDIGKTDDTHRIRTRIRQVEGRHADLHTNGTNASSQVEELELSLLHKVNNWCQFYRHLNFDKNR